MISRSWCVCVYVCVCVCVRYVNMFAWMCACLRERERERDMNIYVYMCFCECLERERERDMNMYMHMCFCECLRERERKRDEYVYVDVYMPVYVWSFTPERAKHVFSENTDSCVMATPVRPLALSPVSCNLDRLIIATALGFHHSAYFTFFFQETSVLSLPYIAFFKTATYA